MSDESKRPHFNFIVTETMLDFMGHMNNATYLTLFEDARWDFITANGYGYPMIQSSQKGPVILEVQLKYLKELTLREHVKIQTDVIDYGSKVGRLRQQMIKSNGEVAAEAIFVFGLLDMARRCLIPPTEDWKKALLL